MADEAIARSGLDGAASQPVTHFPGLVQTPAAERAARMWPSRVMLLANDPPKVMYGAMS